MYLKEAWYVGRIVWKHIIHPYNQAKVLNLATCRYSNSTGSWTLTNMPEGNNSGGGLGFSDYTTNTYMHMYMYKSVRKTQ